MVALLCEDVAFVRGLLCPLHNFGRPLVAMSHRGLASECKIRVLTTVPTDF